MTETHNRKLLNRIFFLSHWKNTLSLPCHGGLLVPDTA